MFAKHLPPSAGAPRVLALDASAAAELPAEVDLTLAAFPVAERRAASERFDAVVGYAPPDRLESLFALLRPGGRLILAHRSSPQLLITALTSAGFVHCLVETAGELTLYRGERPPEGSSLERIHSLSASALSPSSSFVFLLIAQYPSQPAWTLAPGETLEWRAATLIDPAAGRPALLAFSSLVKAVGFMQKAVLANFIQGVNKVGKFRADVARTWELPLLLNPDFERVRALSLGPWYAVAPQTAVTGDE